MENGGLSGRLLHRMGASPVKEPRNLGWRNLGDFILGEIGKGIGLKKRQYRQFPFSGLALGVDVGLVFLNHLAEVVPRDGLTEFYLE